MATALGAHHSSHQDERCSRASHCCGGEGNGVRIRRGGGSHIAAGTNHDGTDAELAEEMNQLSVQERELVLEELHGVADTQEETPEFIATCIDAFDKALNKIQKPKRKALDRAFFLRPTLSSSQSFKLMFLRADYYDAAKAAHRMTKFFDWKSRIFSEDKLAKDICIDDLQPRDLAISFLAGGCLQLPTKDPTGRPITMFDTSKIDHNYQEEMLRVQFYLMMKAVTDDDVAQIKGFTNLTYAPMKRATHIPVSTATENLFAAGDLMSSLPVKVTGYHYCTDNPGMKFVLSIIRMTLGKEVRLRLRAHYGSELEMRYSLLTFGIDCGNLLDCGDGKTAMHDEYVATRRQKENAFEQRRRDLEERTGYVEYPAPNDVLIGRGRPYHEYAGTRRLIALIDTQLDRYFQNNDRFWKTCINMEMVKQIKESNGRFLQRTNKGWKILDDLVSREKAANLFRYRSNTLTKQQQKRKEAAVSAKTATFLNDFALSACGYGAKRTRDDSSFDESYGSSAKRATYDTDSYGSISNAEQRSGLPMAA